MKKVLGLVVIVFMTMISITANAQSNEAFYARGGYSDVTGFVAGEYVVGSTGFAFGWHNYSPPGANETASSFDVALTLYGGPYYENSYYLSTGYASTNSALIMNGTVEEWDGTWSIIGGYKWGSDFMDVKIGCGYLWSDITDGVAVDFSVGIVLFN